MSHVHNPTDTGTAAQHQRVLRHKFHFLWDLSLSSQFQLCFELLLLHMFETNTLYLENMMNLPVIV